MSDTSERQAAPATPDLKSAFESLVEPCKRVGLCHGEVLRCDFCGDVSRTCQLAQCHFHHPGLRCGKEIATTNGWRRCAGLPGHKDSGEGCSAIQVEWADKAIDRSNQIQALAAFAEKLRATGARAAQVCIDRGWGIGWKERGAVLHLGASEFIEAIRGKRGIPEKEAADVLFTLLAACNSHNVNLVTVVKHLEFLVAGGAVESTGKDQT